jgi:hypothetical protein
MDIETYRIEVCYLVNDPEHKSDGRNDWEAILVFPKSGTEIVGRGCDRYQAIVQAVSGIDQLVKTEAEAVA